MTSQEKAATGRQGSALQWYKEVMGKEDTHAKSLARGKGQVQISKASPTFVGAIRHTNNTGELTALGEALRWLLYESDNKNTHVILRPDSEYAMGVALGDNTPRENRELAQWAKQKYRELVVQRQGKVK